MPFRWLNQQIDLQLRDRIGFFTTNGFNRASIGKICYYLTHLLAFAMPLLPRFMSIGVGLLVVLSLFESPFSRKLELIRQRKNYLILFTSLYVLYLVGLIYTTNYTYGLDDVAMKLSLFAFPFVFLASDFINYRQLERVLATFIAGCVITIFFCFGDAFYDFYHTGDPKVFYYDLLSETMHTSYFSMYLNLGLAVLIKFIFDQQNRVRISYFLLLTLFIITIFQLASRAGIFTMILILIYTFVSLILPRIKWRRSLLGLALAVGFSSGILYYSSDVLNRFVSQAPQDQQANADPGSFRVRLIIWKETIQPIKENLLIGVGTGDIKDKLFEVYRDINLEKALEGKYNAHNQYVQTTLALGIMGLLFLLLSFAVPMLQCYRRKHFIYGMFLFIVGFSFINESMLERQYGVMFYAFFNSLLFLSFENTKGDFAEESEQ